MRLAIADNLVNSPTGKAGRSPFFCDAGVLGLYAFVYALCHILNFLLFEMQLDMRLFVQELIERSYIIVGMLAFLILSALAVTSINSAQKNGSPLQSLHNLICCDCIGLIHFYWSLNRITEPLFTFSLCC